MKNWYFWLIMILILGCSLKRNNPLEPSESGIPVPKKVTEIALQNVDSAVLITWKPLEYGSESYIKYYRIYKGLSLNGAYSLIAERPPIAGAVNMSFRDENVVDENLYFYKLSAVNEVGLEGPISSAVNIYYTN